MRFLGLIWARIWHGGSTHAMVSAALRLKPALQRLVAARACEYAHSSTDMRAVSACAETARGVGVERGSYPSLARIEDAARNSLLVPGAVSVLAAFHEQARPGQEHAVGRPFLSP